MRSGAPEVGTQIYRLYASINNFQVAASQLSLADRKGPRPRTHPWVVWVDTASYLGPNRVLPQDVGAYPAC